MSAALVQAVEKLIREVEALKKAAKQPERVSYRPREVAAMTGLSYDAVLDLINTGQLDAIKVGRLHVVPAAAVQQLVERTGDVIVLDERRSA